MPKATIIGAAGGIGSALARDLASQGWSLVLAGRRAEPLSDLAASLTGAAPATLDAGDFGAVDALLAEHADSDAVVNLAGSIILKPAHLTDASEFDETVHQNLRTAFAVVRSAGKHMRSGGSVVLLSTCAAHFGLPNHEAIAAAKGGVDALVRSASATYAAKNLRFNAVAPGLVDTPLASRLTSNEASLKASTAMHALGRIGKADDIARTIAFLIDPRNDWITGQSFGVDGGIANVKPR